MTLHCDVPMADVTMTNATDEIDILRLAGPKAREVFAACTEDDVSNQALHWLGCASLSASGIPMIALRLRF